MFHGSVSVSKISSGDEGWLDVSSLTACCVEAMNYVLCAARTTCCVEDVYILSFKSFEAMIV